MQPDPQPQQPNYPPANPPVFKPSIPPPPPPAQKKPACELAQNSGLRGSGNWTIVGGPGGWYKPSNGNGEVTFETEGVRFRSTSGNTRAGMVQELNRDVSACSSLILSANVRADQQTLTGTGYNGREAPIAVFVKYTDVNGTLHEQLSENPNEPRNMYCNGFYYLDPTSPSINAHGTRVSRGSWYAFSTDLMQTSPRPKFIHFIGAEGGGWPMREGMINNLGLQCR